jgi:acetyl esterase/lipase
MKRLFALPITFVVVAASLLAAETDTAERVQMRASDGHALTGKLYGKSETALVLCHGRKYVKGAESFAAECKRLQARGIMCLALNFRGYPSDVPPVLPGQELDVLAAVDCLFERGAKRVCVLGSSMGGFVALKVLKDLQARKPFAGIILLSAFDTRACRDASCRKLFVIAEDDVAHYAQWTSAFREAPEPKQKLVFKDGGHGQEMFKAHGEELTGKICEFVLGKDAKTKR